MKKFVLLLLLYLVAGWMRALAQVAISEDGSPPDSSAMLDVQSLNKGFLPPRVALVSAGSSAPVTNPAVGLMVYNTATSGISANQVCPGLYWWNGIRWIRTSNEKKFDYPPLPDNCAAYGTVTDNDGNIYPTVLIGTQEWMAQNLKATHDYDGTPFQCITSWVDGGALWDVSGGNTFTYPGWNYQCDSLGCLYKRTQYCPPGFHIPSEYDWNILINFLGGDSVAGGKLKATSFNGTNETCFSALESGVIDNGGYQSYGAYFLLYDGSYRWVRLYDIRDDIYITNNYWPEWGLSIRCVKDY